MKGNALDIFLNGEKLDFDQISPDDTLKDLLKVVEEEIEKGGWILQEVTVDGNPIDLDDPDAVGSLKLLGCRRIDLSATRPTLREHLFQALETGGEGLDFLTTTGAEIAGNLRLGKVKEAMDKHLEFLDAIEWLSMVLKNLSEGFAEVMVESSIEIRRQEIFAKLEEQMKTLQTSQESQDWVAMADVLEYEFPEIFKVVREILNEVKERVSAKPGPG